MANFVLSHDHADPHHHGAWRWLVAVPLGLVLFAVAVAAVAWSYRTDLANAAVERFLVHSGIAPAHVVIDRIDLAGAHARDVELGPLTATEIAASYGRQRLLDRRLDSLTLTEPRLSLAKLGGAGAGVGLPPDWTIDRIVVTSGRIDLDPAGARTVLVDLPAAALTTTGNELHVTLRDATFAVPELKVTAKGVAGDLRWRPNGAGAANITIASLTSAAEPAPIRPAQIALNATLAGARADFTLHAEAAALRLDAKGWHDQSTGTGAADITIPAVTFGPALQPHDLFPMLALDTPLRGTVSVAGPVTWAGTKLGTDLVVHLADVGLDTAGTTLSDVTGDIHLVGLMPPATAPGQELKGTIHFAGLPASPATLRFELRPDATLSVEAFVVAFAGGTLTATPFQLDPAAPDIATTFDVKNVDVAALFELLSVDGLSGTGHLTGRIPIGVDAKGVHLAGLQLNGTEPGVLHVTRDALPKALTQAGGDVELALKALEDFHYAKLSAQFEQGADGVAAVLLTLDGKNPAFMQGQEFHFNIRLESNFDRLADIAVRSMTATQAMLRQAARSAMR